MPLYELFCICAHVPKYEPIKNLVTTAATIVLNAGGVVRGIDSWGSRALPQKIRRHNDVWLNGDYWTMYFHTNPRVLAQLNRRLKLDPMVIRWTFTKLGEKPEDILALESMTRHINHMQQKIPEAGFIEGENRPFQGPSL